MPDYTPGPYINQSAWNDIIILCGMLLEEAKPGDPEHIDVARGIADRLTQLKNSYSSDWTIVYASLPFAARRIADATGLKPGSSTYRPKSRPSRGKYHTGKSP